MYSCIDLYVYVYLSLSIYIYICRCVYMYIHTHSGGSLRSSCPTTAARSTTSPMAQRRHVKYVFISCSTVISYHHYHYYYYTISNYMMLY